MNKNKIICIINARSGSKRLKNKNIRKFYGKPLIYWTINSAIKSKVFSKVFVNTDSREIALIAKNFGADVPFLRPKYLSQDLTSSADSTHFFLKNLNISFDSFSLLQPTSPLRTKNDIINFHKFIESQQFRSALTLSKLHNSSSKVYALTKNHHIRIVRKNNNNSIVNNHYYLNGSMYYNNINSFLRYKKFIFTYTKGYIMKDINSVDIDTYEDFKIAKEFFRYI